MPDKIFNGVIRLRKDTESNFQKIENSFIPANGEACLIVTGTGIRVKVGDGVTILKSLNYIDQHLLNLIDSVVVRGYYHNSKFYTDSTYTEEIPGVINKVYIDANSNIVYTYDASQSKFISINDTLPTASDVQAGITKLYKTKGSAEDGTMTQKSITENLNTKFEVHVDEDNETAIFEISL